MRSRFALQQLFSEIFCGRFPARKPNNRMQLTAVRAAREIVAFISAVADPKR
jgi:hypothetical protein